MCKNQIRPSLFFVLRTLTYTVYTIKNVIRGVVEIIGGGGGGDRAMYNFLGWSIFLVKLFRNDLHLLCIVSRNMTIIILVVFRFVYIYIYGKKGRFRIN